jgi:hypothetical protein
MRLDREHAHALDAADPLHPWRDRFVLPREADGPDSSISVVFLERDRRLPRTTSEVMRDWRSLAVKPLRAMHVDVYQAHAPAWPAWWAPASTKSWR